MADPGLDRILKGLQKDSDLDKEQIKYLLSLSHPSDINLLFAAARNARTRYFGNKIFLYGFLYFSTFCRNECIFCQYRNSNTKLARYRKTREEILLTAKQMADSGVHLIDLTMGEDPKFYFSDQIDQSGFQDLVSMVKMVREEAKLPVMVSPGVLGDNVLEELARAGAVWYACYQETHNGNLYETLRPGQSFHKRLDRKKQARNLGMLVEEGILTGVGENLDDLVNSIIFMRDFPVDQARVMRLVPQPHTPMAGNTSWNSLKEEIIIAVIRLVMPDRLVPASLDVGGLDALKSKLDAGANVITSIVPPEKGLAGVASDCSDIEDSQRTLDSIVPVLKSCRLTPALQEDYQTWITNRKSC